MSTRPRGLSILGVLLPESALTRASSYRHIALSHRQEAAVIVFTRSGALTNSLARPRRAGRDSTCSAGSGMARAWRRGHTGCMTYTPPIISDSLAGIPLTCTRGSTDARGKRIMVQSQRVYERKFKSMYWTYQTRSMQTNTGGGGVCEPTEQSEHAVM